MVKSWITSGLSLPRRWGGGPSLMAFGVPLPVSSDWPLGVAMRTSEVLLSGVVNGFHLLVKFRVRGMGLMSGYCPHDITDSYLLTMTPEPWSGLTTSVVCSHAFGLAKCSDTMTDGGGVCRHLNAGSQTRFGTVCVVVSGDRFAEMLCMDSCHSLSNVLTCR